LALPAIAGNSARRLVFFESKSMDAGALCSGSCAAVAQRLDFDDHAAFIAGWQESSTG
jgi:hypothetical protein